MLQRHTWDFARNGRSLSLPGAGSAKPAPACLILPSRTGQKTRAAPEGPARSGIRPANVPLPGRRTEAGAPSARSTRGSARLQFREPGTEIRRTREAPVPGSFPALIDIVQAQQAYAAFFVH